MLQAKPGRSGKQEHYQNSPNPGTTFLTEPCRSKLYQFCTNTVSSFLINTAKVQSRRACGHLWVNMALGEVLLLAGGGGDHVQLDGLLLSSHGEVSLLMVLRSYLD